MKDRWGKRAVKSEWEREEGSDTVRQSEREGSRQRDGCSRVAEVRRWCNDQITDTLEPSSRPSCPQKKKKRKNLEAHLEERKACSCKWPRCQSSSGWRRESGSGLPESAIRGAHSSSPVLPRRERGVLLLQHTPLSLSDFLKMLQISCLTVRRQQSRWKAGGEKQCDPEGSYLTRSFSNIRNDQYTSKK